MSGAEVFLRYGVALAVGMLVGLQRQFSSGRKSEDLPAGVRTIALIGLSGCAAAHISDLSGSPLPLAGALIMLGAFLTAMYVIESGRRHTGLTTQMSVVVTFLSGALAYHDRMALAGTLGVVTTALLSFKPELHNLARNLTREDITSTLKFSLLGVVFLPLLPDRSFWPPPFDVLNPFQIGLFIVLISAVEFVGYVLSKLLGTERGIGLLGLLGGLVSSTAVTFGFAQRSRSQPPLSGSLALGILASWTVMFGRTLVVVAILDADVVRRIWMPLAASLASAAGYCVWLHFRRHPGGNGDASALPNPFELGPALKFGLLFIAIVTAARSAQVYFGDLGTYLSSFAAGLVDVDAISYSMTRMAGSGLDPDVAGNAVLLAALANTLLKGGFAVAAGAQELRKPLLPGLALIVAAGTLAALFS